MWGLDICEVWVMVEGGIFSFQKNTEDFFRKFFLMEENGKKKKEEIFLGKICEGEQ